MAEGDLNYESSQTRLEDPEPISIGIALFAACVSTGGLALQLWRRHKDEQAERGKIRRRLYEVDRGLNRLEESYNELSLIYSEQGVLDVSDIGEGYIEGDQDEVRQVDKLRNTVFESWKELEKALDELSELVGEESQHVLNDHQDDLSQAFYRAKNFEDLRSLMIAIGEMLVALSWFIGELSHEYDFPSPYTNVRVERLETIVHQLREEELAGT